MIIGRGKCEGDQLLLLGLSRENVKRLTAGQPIEISRKSHGDAAPDGWTIAIVFGETEAELAELLKAGGAVDSQTNIHIDPKLR
jgi:hypothetical protein